MIDGHSAWERFQASLNVGFDQWHDGIGYDLAALGEMSAEERESVRSMMAARIRGGSASWREVEVAGVLGDRAALQAAAKSKDDIVSRRALEALGDSRGAEAKVAAGVLSGNWTVFSQALDSAPDHKTEPVKRALIERVRRRDDGCVPAGMVLLEVFAGVEDAWPERPMLFRIREEPEGGRTFQDLVRRVGSL